MPLQSIDRRANSTMDLTRLSALSDTPDKVLLVSDRTLYLLANLAQNEVTRYSLYANQLFDNGLADIVDPGQTVPATLVDTIANNFALEVTPEDGFVRPIIGIIGRNDVQSIPNNLDTLIQFDKTVYDPDGICSISSNSLNLVPGVWDIQLQVYYIYSAGTFRRLWLRVYGSANTLSGLVYNTVSTQVAMMTLNYRLYTTTNMGVFGTTHHDIGTAFNIGHASLRDASVRLSAIGYPL